MLLVDGLLASPSLFSVGECRQEARKENPVWREGVEEEGEMYDG